MAVERVRMSPEGPEASRFALGWASAIRVGLDARAAADHIRAGLALGITTMDTAAIYGNGLAEGLLGAALASDPGLRDQLEIVTKCAIGGFGTTLYHYDTSRAAIVDSVEHSLRELHTDHVDALLLHRPDALMDADEVAGAFTALRSAGKVLHFGVSNHTVSQFDLLSSRLAFPLVTNEIQCSVMHLEAWADGTLDQCQGRRIRPMAWSPLGGGRLFRNQTAQAGRLRTEIAAVGAQLGGATMDQVALAWLLKHPAGIIPILGSLKSERLPGAVAAAALTLTREQWYRIWMASTGERRLP